MVGLRCGAADHPMGDLGPLSRVDPTRVTGGEERLAGAPSEGSYGKTSEQRLRSGRYRVRLTATDPAGNTSATTTIRFRVDRG